MQYHKEPYVFRDYAMSLADLYEEMFRGSPSEPVDFENNPMVFGAPTTPGFEDRIRLRPHAAGLEYERTGSWASTLISPHFHSVRRRMGEVVVHMGRMEKEDGSEDVAAIAKLAGAMRFYVEPNRMMENTVDLYLRNPWTLLAKKYPPKLVERYAIISPQEARISESYDATFGLCLLDRYVDVKDSVFSDL